LTIDAVKKPPAKEVFSSDCQKTVKIESFGGKESVKENRQGFLSRSIKQDF